MYRCTSWLPLGFARSQWRGCDGIFLDTTYASPKHTFPLQVSRGHCLIVRRTLAAACGGAARPWQRALQGP